MKKFWPGPLTIIFKKKPAVLDLVTGGLDTVALRCPNHHLALNLISGAGPLVAPSANRSGRPSPTRLEHIFEDFGIDFPVVDGGRTTIGLESTVLDVTASPMVIYRPGKISGEELERATGERVIYDSGMGEGATRSPGTKYSHYAPVADVQWLDSEELGKQEEALYLYHCSSPSTGGNIINYSGDYTRMASELYDRFRQADHDGYKQILIQQFDAGTVEQNPFVQALENRISRAAKP